MTGMPTAKARVQTSRADRYLAQLVDHLTQVGQHGAGQHNQHRHGQHTPHGDPGGPDGPGGQGHAGPPVVRHVERTDGHARIEFDWGLLALTATASELILEVRADDPAALARGQDLIKHRVETIGHRDRLTVTWQSPRPDSADD